MAAWHDNAVLLLASPAAVYLGLRWLVEWLRGRPLARTHGQSVAALSAAVAWAVVHNVFWGPPR